MAVREVKDGIHFEAYLAAGGIKFIVVDNTATR